MKKETVQPQDKYVLRMPDGMRDKLKEHAQLSGRSLNAELIARLELSLEDAVWDRQEFIRNLNNRQTTVDHLMVQLSHSMSNVNFYKELLKTEKENSINLRIIIDLLLEKLMDKIDDLPEEIASIIAKCYVLFNKSENEEDTPFKIDTSEIDKLNNEIEATLNKAEQGKTS